MYDFALSEESGEIYECNLTRNTFRIIRHSSGTFLPLPDEGRLDDLKAMVRESMIHPKIWSVTTGLSQTPVLSG